MNRDDLRHILRAASRITGATEIIVAGSQSILGSFQNTLLPDDATRSVEADLLFGGPAAQDEIDLVDGAIGEASQFHATFGVYAQGIDPSTATLPHGWLGRLVPFIVDDDADTMGLCLDPNDLAVAKLVASRTKDLQFLKALIDERLLSVPTILERLETTELAPQRQEHAVAWLSRFPIDTGPTLNKPVPTRRLQRRLDAWIYEHRHLFEEPRR